MMQRYRIVLEIAVPNGTSREAINGLAQRCSDECVTKWSNPVYLSTERVEMNKDILKSNSLAS